MNAPTRKLAAILAADVAGYSKLMGEDETRTLAALRELRGDIFQSTVAEHRGDVVKSMGLCKARSRSEPANSGSTAAAIVRVISSCSSKLSAGSRS